MIQIRPMSPDDLPLGRRLSAQAGWNQTEADWRRFLRLAPEGSFVAEWSGVPVATTIAFVFDAVGWIAMVLVDQAFRQRGIATRLMSHAIEQLERRGVQTVRLDATPLGRPVYERLGFVAEYAVLRLQAARPRAGGSSAYEPLPATRVAEICELDRHLAGTDRSELIRALYDERPGEMTAVFSPRGPVGYATWRPGRRAAQIGPAIAREPEIGAAMLDQVLGRCPPDLVFIDIPADNAAAVRWAAARAFTIQREFTRMRRGRPISDFPAQLWACSGPEKG